GTLLSRGAAPPLTTPLSAYTTLFGSKAGTYVAQLIVNDGTVDSAPVTVTITTQNSPPVANAGANQSVVVGATVTLDGSASKDVDGNALTFRWALTVVPAGSAATLTNA